MLSNKHSPDPQWQHLFLDPDYRSPEEDGLAFASGLFHVSLMGGFGLKVQQLCGATLFWQRTGAPGKALNHTGTVRASG